MPLSRIKENRCRKNVIRQVDSKNEWLLLFAPNFTEKYALDFVLTLENAWYLALRAVFYLFHGIICRRRFFS